VKERFEKEYGRQVIEQITLLEWAELDEGYPLDLDNEYDQRLLALAEEHGWHTPMYFSEFIEAPFPTQKIDEMMACKAALRYVMRGWRTDEEPFILFKGFDEAIRALDDWELWVWCGGDAQDALKNLLAEAGRLPKLIESADVADLDIRIEGRWPVDTDTWNQATIQVLLRGVPVPTFKKTGAEVLDVGGYMWWPWWNWRMDHETQKLAERHLDNLVDRFIRENMVQRGVQWPRKSPYKAGE
jgi:hypothetical protein